MSSSRRTFGRAVGWAMVLAAGTRGIGLVVTFLLAALIGPADFGVVAVAVIYVMFIRLVLEQGFGTAIIQREGLEDEHLDSAFWLNVVWCAALAGLSFASAGWWADVNDMPRLEAVIQVLSLVVVTEGLQIVPQAVLERNLDYRRLAIRANAAVVLGGAIGIALALAGAGVWALVAQQLALESTLLILVWILSSWRPRLRFSRRHARELLGFSIHVFLANLAGAVNQRADALLLGIFFGPVAVGLYRLADRLVDVLLDLTMRPVARVTLPILSRLQGDRDALRAAAGRSLRTTLLLAVPVLLVVAASSRELVSVLGEEWEDAGLALQFLCLVGIGKALAFFAGPVLFAVNRPGSRALMQWAFALLSAGAVVVVGQLLTDASLEDQLLGMSASRALFFLGLVAPISLAIVLRVTGLRLRTFLRALPGPVLAGGAAVAVVQALRYGGVVESLPAFAALLVVGGAATLVAAAVVFALEGEVRTWLLAQRRGAFRRDVPAAEAALLNAASARRDNPSGPDNPPVGGGP